MMVLLFLLLLISVILIWLGKRKPAIIVFMICWGLGFIWFLHHATDHLNISL